MIVAFGRVGKVKGNRLTDRKRKEFKNGAAKRLNFENRMYHLIARVEFDEPGIEWGVISPAIQRAAGFTTVGFNDRKNPSGLG